MASNSSVTLSILASTAMVALAAPAQAETVRIGIMLPYSGVNADLGDVQDKAIDLYVKLHGNMVGPHKIELIKRDEGPASGANAKTVATELITRDKVNMIAGVVFSPSAIAMAPVVTQAKTPFLIGNAGTAWITNLSPYIARLSFSMWSTGYPMGSYAAKNLGCKTTVMGYTDFPPGKDSTDAFKTGFEQAGGKIMDSIPMGNPVQVPDFTPFLERVKNEKPDCFYTFIPSGAHAAGIVKAYGEVGLRQTVVKLIGTMDVTPELLQRARQRGQQGVRQGVARGLRRRQLPRLHVGGRLGHDARHLRHREKARRQARRRRQGHGGAQGLDRRRPARQGRDRPGHARRRAGRARA
jgi:branched-chain amino acid transport system substrate-binding protein